MVSTESTVAKLRDGLSDALIEQEIYESESATIKIRSNHPDGLDLFVDVSIWDSVGNGTVVLAPTHSDWEGSGWEATLTPLRYEDEINLARFWIEACVEGSLLEVHTHAFGGFRRQLVSCQRRDLVLFERRELKVFSKAMITPLKRRRMPNADE